MKQIQRRTTEQVLALSQHMCNSLSLLHMGSEDVVKALERECCRNPFIKSPVPVRPTIQGTPGGDARKIENFNAEQSNTDYLIEQVSQMMIPANERELASELVHCLDERGFFTENAEEISKYIYASPHVISTVVAKLQASIEPTGVFAWSLQDCFRIQLETRHKFSPLMAKLLKRLDLVAAQNVVGISELLGVDQKHTEAMLCDIRGLRPSPFSRQPTFQDMHQVADLIFSISSESEVAVEINVSAFPDLLTNDTLFSTVKITETNDASLAYYRDCYRSAAAFVLAMQKRANTLILIGKEIAQVQSRFIRAGRPLDRKPLTMSGISKKLGMNKSTISRALNECLFETPQGLISAHEFIVRPLTASTDQKTREQAFSRLSLLIKTEDRNHPYSDEMLAEQLSNMNLAISRRTVAKYRGILGIPNVFVRRFS